MAVIPGTINSETLTGGIADDVLNALAGADTLDGGSGGVDTLNGDAGSDVLYVRADDFAYGGDDADLLIVQSDGVAVLDGGLGDDTLRFDSTYDISGTTLTGVENLFISSGYLTAAQLGSFALVSGYASNYTTATAYLTAGGTATVNLSATLTAYFQLYGTNQAEQITFNAGYVGIIYAYLGAGNDLVNAGGGGDSLRGDPGDDTLNGLGGADLIDGGVGADLMNGGDGNDTLFSGTGDVVLGGLGDDLLSVGADGPATLNGGGGTLDAVRLESNYDLSSTTITGAEQLLISSVTLTLAQLDAFTLVSGYSAGYTTATAYLTAGGTASVTLSSTLSQYFSLYGSSDADAITFAPAYGATIYVYAGTGDDSITGANGADSLRGDGGNDTLIGGNGIDTLDGGIGADSLYGGGGNDTLIARTFDGIYGGANDDLISVQGDGPLMLDGGTGTNDILRFESGYDITGATVVGIEQINLNGTVAMTAAQLDLFARVAGYAAGYTSAALALTQGGTADIVLEAGLTLGFTLYGSTGADLITFAPANIAAISLYAGAGNESIAAASGFDYLRGDGGNDTLRALNGNDTLDGGIGADLLDGGAGNDYFFARSFDSIIGGANDDLIDVVDSQVASINGGTGIDTLRFASGYDVTSTTITAVENLNLNGTVSLTAAQLGSFASVSGYAPGYTSASVVLTVGGSAVVTLSALLAVGFTLTGSSMADDIRFNAAYVGAISTWAGFGNDSITSGNGSDHLRGESGNDTLSGLSGNDTLEGGTWADVLIGGIGVDSLTGGAGRDTFVFATVTASLLATPDRITDFEVAGAGLGDLIDLSAIDADGGLGVNDAFLFGSAGLGGLSLIDSGTDTLVRLNTDADAAFESVILIADGAVSASSYTAADFNL